MTLCKNFVRLRICAQMPREKFIPLRNERKKNKRNNMRIAADFTMCVF